VSAAVGLPCYFSPVAGPVVRAAEARDNPLPWKRATGGQHLLCIFVSSFIMQKARYF